MEYKSTHYNGPLNVGDEVVIEAGINNPYHNRYKKTATITRFKGNLIYIAINGTEGSVFSPGKDDSFIISEVLKREIPIENKKIISAIIPNKVEWQNHKEKMYGRQIAQEEKSLPPKEVRPFEFL